MDDDAVRAASFMTEAEEFEQMVRSLKLGFYTLHVPEFGGVALKAEGGRHFEWNDGTQLSLWPNTELDGNG